MKIVIFLSITLWLSNKVYCQTEDCLDQYSYYDTISTNGNFIKFHKKNDFIILEYGNNSIHRTLDYQFPCQTADSWIPKFEWDNKDMMGLKYVCGSPCWGIWILPLDTLSIVRNIIFPMAYDLKNRIIAYLDNNNYTSLIIENLYTHKITKIEFPFKSDHGEFIGYWIEEVSIKDNNLYYKYSNPNEDFDKRKSTEVMIKLN